MLRHEVLPQIAAAIAEADGRSPHDLDYSLREFVDTEALLSLVESEHTGWKLTFEVPDHTVEIRGSGQIRVDYAVVGQFDRPEQ